jgi:hypothetical protein
MINLAGIAFSLWDQYSAIVDSASQLKASVCVSFDFLKAHNEVVYCQGRGNGALGVNRCWDGYSRRYGTRGVAGRLTQTDCPLCLIFG